MPSRYFSFAIEEGKKITWKDRLRVPVKVLSVGVVVSRPTAAVVNDGL
jgi:hypothetical protein